MWVRSVPYILLLIFTSTDIASCFGKGSLTYVIDTTPSMTSEINQVKQSTNSITQVVFDEKSSQIKNMVLVTFSDPNADLRIVTDNRDVFKRMIDQVFIKMPNVYDCPEMSMAGTLLALEKSLPGSYVYVFTDASAKDHPKSSQVIKMCQQKQSQIVFILTGDCNDYETHPYQIYYDIAAACSGLAFYIRKDDVFSIFEPIKDAIKGKKEMITSRTIEAHTTKEIPFEINDQTEYASVTASGKNVILSVRGSNYNAFRSERLTWLSNVKMLRLSQLIPGTYIATVRSSSITTINIFSRTDFSFEYGFSGLDANTLKDTLPQPIAGTTTHLFISVTDPNHTTNITSALILDMNENVMPNFNLPLRRIRDNYYVTPPFVSPSTNFKIAVFGKAANTGKAIRRLARFPITPQPAEKVTVPELSGKTSESVKIGASVDIKCVVTKDVPAPKISWEFMANGKSKFEHIAGSDNVLHISKVRKEDAGRYKCIASNLAGISEHVTTLVVDFKPSISTDNSKVYEGLEGDRTLRIPCNSNGVPPAEISWSVDGTIITNGPHYSISSGALIITNPKTTDSKIYKCEAKNYLGSAYADFNVKIKGIPKINSGGTALYEGSDGDAVLRIPCKANGIPPPIISWSVNGQIITPGPHYSINDGVLEIRKPKMTDSSTYRCEATNYLGSTHADFDVKIKGVPYIKSNDSKTLEGLDGDATLRIPCNAVGVPRPTITWSINGNTIRTDSHYSVSADGTLLIKNPKMKDTGSYTCKATNSLGSGSTVIEVKIKGVPHINSNDTAIYKGSERDAVLKIPCEAIGVPPPTISWSVNGKTIRPGPHYSINGGVLVIKNPKMIDSGTYRCEASNPMGSTHADFNITVVGVPYIKSNDTAKSIDGSDGDSTLRIPCNAIGVPRPTITWSINGNTIRTDSHYSVSSDGTLVIKNPKMKDTGSYTCKATNSLGSGSTVIEVKIKGVPHINSNGTATYKGSERDGVLKIPCEAIGVPPPTISWSVNGKTIRPGPHYSINGGVLVIKNPKMIDSGTYRCEASNPMGSTHADFNITVVGVPYIKSNDTAKSIDGSDGDSTLRIPCNAIGVPRPTITWSINGNTIRTDSHYSVSSDGTLVIKNPKMKDTGSYTCKATNSLGSGSTVIEVKIKGVPHINSNGTATYKGSERDGVLKIPCEAIGVPPPTISWSVNGKTIRPGPHYSINGGVLVIKNPKMIDSGTYRCEASNHMGSTHADFNVTVVGVPYIKSNDTTKSIDGSDGDSTLRIPCNAIGVPPPVITWSINGYTIRTDSHYSILSDGTLLIKKPKMVDSGLYKCVATNNLGSGQFEFNVTVKGAPHIKPNSSKVHQGLEGDVALRIPCDAVGIPPPTITWSLNGKPITTGPHYSIVDGVLIIKNPKIKDSGSYKCKATNNLGSTVIVHNVTVDDHLDDYGIIEVIKINKKKNSWYRLECGMPGQSVRWYMEGNYLNEKGNFLILDDLDAAYNGNYTCRVSDTIQSYTKTYHLVIDGPPKFEFEQEDPVFDWTGNDDDELNCNIETTNNVKVDWTYNGELLSDHKSLMLNVGGKWGKYTCNVSNDFGSIQRTFDVISSRCLVPKDHKKYTSMPLILNERSNWPINTISNYITFERNEKIMVYCPNYGRERNNLKKFPRVNEITAVCDKQDTFIVNGKPYKISDLDCNHYLTPTILFNNKRCGKGSTKNAVVGYNKAPNFLETYEVCFDISTNMPQYSLVVMPKNYQSLDVHYNWYKHPVINYPTSKGVYTCKDSTSTCCYGKSQLVSARDFSDGPAQNTTFIESINAIPFWRPCQKTETTWQDIEEKIRLQLDMLPASIVWSGTHTFRRRNGHLVPRYLFKLVEFIGGDSVAVVYVNGPSPSNSDVLCKNICADGGVIWLEDLHNHFYCCNGDEFREVFNFNAHKDVNINL